MIFLPRRSHKLINITRRPVCRPGFSFRSAPRVLVPLGSPVARSVPRPVVSARSCPVSSSRPVISFAYRSPIAIPSGGAYPIHGGRNDNGGTVGNGDGGVAVFFFLVRRFPKLIIVRHGIMVLIIGGV